jgi:hypothetical protein
MYFKALVNNSLTLINILTKFITNNKSKSDKDEKDKNDKDEKDKSIEEILLINSITELTNKRKSFERLKRMIFLFPLIYTASLFVLLSISIGIILWKVPFVTKSLKSIPFLSNVNFNPTVISVTSLCIAFVISFFVFCYF